MNKQLMPLILLLTLALSACGTPPLSTQNTLSNEKTAQQNGSDQSGQKAAVNEAEMATDEDADGFGRLPGEPSRADGHYYITGEICQQFTKKFMAGIMNKTVREAKPSHAELTNCQYSFGEPNQYGQAPNILLSLSFLSIENQVKGHEMMKRTVAADPSIPMANYVVKQENGLINEIYLVLGQNKFLSLNRSSGQAISEEEMLDVAVKIGTKIKDFK